jgi:hypothetical protein
MSVSAVPVGSSGLVRGRDVLTTIEIWIGLAALLGSLGYWATAGSTARRIRPRP